MAWGDRPTIRGFFQDYVNNDENPVLDSFSQSCNWKVKAQFPRKFSVIKI